MTTPTYAATLETSTATELRDQTLDDLAALGCSMVGVNVESADRGLIEIFARAMAGEQDIRRTIALAASKVRVMEIEDVATRDAWMDVVAAWYQRTRLAASKASHRFVLTGSAAAPAYPIAPGALLAQTDDGIQFRNTGRLTSDLTAAPGTVTLTAGDSRSDLEWAAVLPGTSGNIGVDTNLELVTTLAGVAVTNPQIGSSGSSLLRSGTDTELSSALSIRCDARWDRTAVAQLPGALVEWIVEAFETGGLASTITKWRVDDTNPNGPGSTDLYLANASGAATAEELALVNTYEQPRRACGSGPLRVLPAEELSVPFTATLYRLGSSTTVAADAATVIDTLEALIPMGGTLYGDDITKALRSLVDVRHVEHNLEGVTTTAGVNQVIVLVPTFEVK
jgi:hypothetical protein